MISKKYSRIIVILLAVIAFVPSIYFYNIKCKKNGTRTVAVNQPYKSAFFNDLLLWNKTGAKPDHLANILTALTIKEPLTPANYTGCFSPLQPVRVEDCSLHPEAFDKELRPRAAKVGLVMQFGHDIDTLEIHLHELYDVVDKFFILESSRSFNPRIVARKPLFLEHVIHKERFRMVESKIVHLILDDVTAAEEVYKPSVPNKYHLEIRQEAERWRKFLAWNSATGYFSDDDIIGFTDVDEIVTRENIHLMKSCKFKDNKPVTVAMWFAYGRLNTGFKTDHYLPGYQYTLIDETFWPLGLAKSQPVNLPPNRRRRNPDNYIKGGMHLTRYGYLPLVMLKFESVIEGSSVTVRHLAQMALEHYDHGKNNTATELYTRGILDDGLQHRVKPLSELSEDQKRGFYCVPKYLACNLQRFPAWIDVHDTRLD